MHARTHAPRRLPALVERLERVLVDPCVPLEEMRAVGGLPAGGRPDEEDALLHLLMVIVMVCGVVVCVCGGGGIWIVLIVGRQMQSNYQVERLATLRT
jgi:hypothetical protein